MSEVLAAIQKQMDDWQIHGGCVGGLSDGFHTYDELYEHRCVLFSIICRLFPERSFRAYQHDDGSMFEGMFITGVETPQGQFTYHFFMKEWDRFEGIPILEKAPVYDSHRPVDVERLYTLLEKHKEPLSEV